MARGWAAAMTSEVRVGMRQSGRGEPLRHPRSSQGAVRARQPDPDRFRASAGRGAERVMAAIVRQRPTRRQLEVLRAHIVAGSIAIAAHEVAISESTARRHLSGSYRRTGCQDAAQAACLLGRAESVAPSAPRLAP